MLERVRESLGRLVAQLFFIAAGVYLGNQADQWKEARDRRQAARAALENFRTELRLNRADVARKQPEHYRLGQAFLALRRDRRPAPRTVNQLFARVGWRGAYPLSFRQVAWDLALANQSLTYVDPTLAFAIVEPYTEQRELLEFQRTTMQNALSPTGLSPGALTGFAMPLTAFTTDGSKYMEPDLLRRYDRLLPRLDSAIARLPK